MTWPVFWREHLKRMAIRSPVTGEPPLPDFTTVYFKPEGVVPSSARATPALETRPAKPKVAAVESTLRRLILCAAGAAAGNRSPLTTPQHRTTMTDAEIDIFSAFSSI
jgi:hypothetical protein